MTNAPSAISENTSQVAKKLGCINFGKFGLRALSQSLAKAYSKDGVHVVHVRLDCDLDVPLMREHYGERFNPEQAASTDDVAETYWWAHQ